MDPVAFDKSFDVLNLAERTKIQYYDSQRGLSEGFLDDNTIQSKLPEIETLGRDVGLTRPTLTTTKTTRFILIFATGEGIHDYEPLSISKASMRALMQRGNFQQHLVSVYALSQPHFSYEVQYDAGQVRPIAVHMYLRLPRNSQMISITMRIRLSDLSTLCILSSAVSLPLSDIRDRCMRQTALLEIYPLQLLNFALERRKDDFRQWVEALWHHVSDLECVTGMTSWPIRREPLAPKHKEDFTALLQQLHAQNVELRLAQTTMTFAAGLGPQFKKALTTVEDMRQEMGIEGLKRGYRAAIEDQTDYNEEELRAMVNKVVELLYRVESQIQVTYSLIAQKDSEQNIRIAEGSRDIARLTADDSRTMKTITVMTLIFLPSTMLASLWDAGIFTLDPERSWRIYLGTTFALTIVVFLIWYLYIWLSTRKPVVKRVLADEEKGKIS